MEGLVFECAGNFWNGIIVVFFSNMLDRFFFVGIMYMLLVGLWLGD